MKNTTFGDGGRSHLFHFLHPEPWMPNRRGMGCVWGGGCVGGGLEVPSAA